MALFTDDLHRALENEDAVEAVVADGQGAFAQRAGLLLDVEDLSTGPLKKDAGGFDLPRALALLVATEQLPPDRLRDWAIVGELALDGSVRPFKGALAMALAWLD